MPATKTAKAATKVCTLCKVEQPLDNFSRDSQKKDGRSSWCGPCTKAKNEAYKAAREASQGQPAPKASATPKTASLGTSQPKPKATPRAGTKNGPVKVSHRSPPAPVVSID